MPAVISEHSPRESRSTPVDGKGAFTEESGVVPHDPARPSIVEPGTCKPSQAHSLFDAILYFYHRLSNPV